MAILEVKDLTFTYPLAKRPALDGVSFDVKDGEFVVLCGDTGSGKSTLLRLLKPQLSAAGQRSGTVRLDGADIENSSPCRIGFIMQNPDMQIVTDKVWHELAFGLENMGVPSHVISRRVAEMASYFGIEDWYDRHVSTLSGGQKQLLNLASVMVMDPDILILDEPTSQLDPIATSDFLGAIKKLNRDLSLTVIIAEHRLEELIPMCDRMLIMDSGRLVHNGYAGSVLASLDHSSPLLSCMPAASRLAKQLGRDDDCPVTVRQGRRFIEENFDNKTRALDIPPYTHSDKIALSFKNVYFRYEKHSPDVLRGLDFCVYEREIFCILGGNGSGKTTALSCAADLHRIYSGEIRVFGKPLRDYRNGTLYQNCLTLLPQDVQTVFLCNSVAEELKDAGITADELPFDLSSRLQMHPYDLSGGEQQLLALAKALATKPRLLLIDEPTKGIDANRKLLLANIIRRLRDDGATVVIVTHDTEFAAMCADRCALFFRGNIVSCEPPRQFFSQNNFYTTAAARMTKGYFDNTVTVGQVAELCLKNSRGESAR